jgi:[acyl-carrier-protein] S-malonyltransferase
LWRVAIGGWPRPTVVAGHSLGEYTALVAAGALLFRDALPLVRSRRSDATKSDTGVGAMAAILGLDCRCRRGVLRSRAGQVVEPVSFNAPAQVVIAGNKEAVEGAVAAESKGAKRALLLPVSHRSTARSWPAAERLAATRRGPIHPPHNTGVAQCRRRRKPTPMRYARRREAGGNPVRWVEAIRLSRSGATHIVECGPGKVLAGLSRKIVPDVQSYALSDDDAIASTLSEIRAGPASE